MVCGKRGEGKSVAANCRSRSQLRSVLPVHPLTTGAERGLVISKSESDSGIGTYSRKRCEAGESVKSLSRRPLRGGSALNGDVTHEALDRSSFRDINHMCKTVDGPDQHLAVSEINGQFGAWVTELMPSSAQVPEYCCWVWGGLGSVALPERDRGVERELELEWRHTGFDQRFERGRFKSFDGGDDTGLGAKADLLAKGLPHAVIDGSGAAVAEPGKLLNRAQIVFPEGGNRIGLDMLADVADQPVLKNLAESSVQVVQVRMSWINTQIEHIPSGRHVTPSLNTALQGNCLVRQQGPLSETVELEAPCYHRLGESYEQ